MMELVSPAGNIEKLSYVYEYGADAAYIGLKKFSLRVKADNFYDNEYEQVTALKKKYPQKRLFCALNITFHNNEIDNFLSEIDYFRQYPIDAFIIQDIGMVSIIRKYFPNAALHLSTQANCINREAVKVYRDLGFKRVVLGREASLSEIRQIKDAVPEMELEVFAHGAMCIAYSGRCLMSAYMTARSANSGFCSHSCRWEYKLGVEEKNLRAAMQQTDGRGMSVSPEAWKELAQSGLLSLEEHERPGEFFPVFEGDNFTAVLSSKDLCMAHHLADMKAAGVDSLKIEGRMKSLYYAALTARAYRKAIDSVEGIISTEQAAPYIAELYNASHREFGTGFFYSREDADKTTTGASDSEYEMAGTVGAELSEEEIAQFFEASQKLHNEYSASLDALHPQARRAAELSPSKVKKYFTEQRNGWKFYRYTSLNKIHTGVELEYVGPDHIAVKDNSYILVSPETFEIMDWVCHGHECLLYTGIDLEPSWIARFRTVK